jgi:hypothetical protein
MTDSSDEDTANPSYADQRKFYKVEQWSKDDQHVIRMLWAGNSIDIARDVFRRLVKHRPGGRYTVRQGVRVLEKWPQ